MLDGRADVAVHSAKDLPSVPHDGARRSARSCARRDAADALIGRSLDELAAGATVAIGLGAPPGPARRGAPGPDVRRAARQHRHPAVEGPRRRRHRDGRRRPRRSSGSTDRIAERLDPSTVRAAVGQGCVAVECRAGRRRDGRRCWPRSTTPRPATPSRSSAASSPSSAPAARCRSAPTSPDGVCTCSSPAEDGAARDRRHGTWRWRSTGRATTTARDAAAAAPPQRGRRAGDGGAATAHPSPSPGPSRASSVTAWPRSGRRSSTSR